MLISRFDLKLQKKRMSVRAKSMFFTYASLRKHSFSSFFSRIGTFIVNQSNFWLINMFQLLTQQVFYLQKFSVT